MKTAVKLKADDPQVYVKLGRIGGTKSRGGGFTGRPDLARKAGPKGGRPKGSAKRYREFLVIDETIDSPVIEFEKKSIFKGWFRRRQS